MTLLFLMGDVYLYFYNFPNQSIMSKVISLLSFQFLILSSLFSQMTIEEARQMPIGSTVEIQGIVTHGEEMGPIRYLQDATGGLPIYAPGNFSDEALEGHEIKLSLKICLPLK